MGPEDNPRDDEPIDQQEYEKWEASQNLPSERTFTSAELALNQAAILREAASAVSGVLGDRAIDQAHRVIFAIPTDQPALDRHDATLQAQTAALLEKAAALRCPFCEQKVPRDPKYGHTDGRLCAAKDILRLIPASAAAVLEERERKARADATEQCAIEAGERSPEGCSSHTMLGDMWDRRIVELRAEKGAKQP